MASLWYEECCHLKELKDIVTVPLRWNRDPAPSLHYYFLVAHPLSLNPFPSGIIALATVQNLPFGTHSKGWSQESLPAREPHKDLFHPEHSQRRHCRREKPRNVKSGTGPRINSTRLIHSPIFTELFRACLISALKYQTDNGKLHLIDQTAPRQTAIYGNTAGFRHAYKGFLN